MCLSSFCMTRERMIRAHGRSKRKNNVSADSMAAEGPRKERRRSWLQHVRQRTYPSPSVVESACRQSLVLVSAWCRLTLGRRGCFRFELRASLHVGVDVIFWKVESTVCSFN